MKPASKLENSRNYFACVFLLIFLGGCSQEVEQQEKADPAWASAKNVQQQFENGSLTSVDLVQHYLDEIERNNYQGYNLRAVIEVNPDALSIAAALDLERELGVVRSPLHGIPVLLKANIATADEMATTAGASVLAGFILVGMPWSEAQLFSLASFLETELGGFQQPKFLRNLDTD